MAGTAKMSIVPCAPSRFWFIDPRLHSLWLLSYRQMGLDSSLCGILLYDSANGRGNLYLIDFYLIAIPFWTAVTKPTSMTCVMSSSFVREKG